jgi:hypothetical protein
MAGVAPQASPMIREPKWGRRNPDLETIPSNFMVSNIASVKANNVDEVKKQNYSLAFLTNSYARACQDDSLGSSIKSDFHNLLFLSFGE